MDPTDAMDASDVAGWRRELSTRVGRLEDLVCQHPDAAAARWVQAQLAEVRAAAATAHDQWRIAEVDDTEATVIGRALHLVYGGARLAPSVEGTALRHPRQPLYGPEDVYTPCGALLLNDGPDPGTAGHLAFDNALESLGRQAAAVLAAGAGVTFVMSSGMAAIRVPALLLLNRLRATGRKVVVPADIYGEILDLLTLCGPDVFRTVPAETAEELAAHADASDVGAVMFEPVTNTPRQRVLDPQRFWAALRRDDVAVVVDVSQNPLQDISTGVPPGLPLFIVCSMTKWAAGGSQRQSCGLLIAHTDAHTIDELLAIRAMQRAAPARLEDAAWMDVDSTASLRSRLTRYQRNQVLLAHELRAAPVEVRYQPGAAYVLLVDRSHTPGWAARTASAVLREAGASGMRIGRHGTFGMSEPALSVVRSGTEYGLRLTAGSGPGSIARRLADTVLDTLHTPLAGTPSGNVESACQ